MSLFFAILLALFFSALFSGTEIAFFSANKLFIKVQEDKETKAGRILAGFYKKESDFLSMLLVGNNIALVVFSALMTIPLDRFFHEYLAWKNQLAILLVETVLITLLVLVFGEFLPKTLFRLYADKLLLFLAIPLRLVAFFLRGPALLMTWSSNFIIKNFMGKSYTETQQPFSKADLLQLILSTGSSEKEEELINTEIFAKALNLHETRVRECMVPRTEIDGLDVNSSIQELIELFKKSRHSRLILYKEELDKVVGYVHHQDLLHKPDAKNLKELQRPIIAVPESLKVHTLLNKFVKENINIAWVLDEYGGTAGIVTLEDVIEEIFGEIEDEHDKPEYIEKKLGEKHYLFSGRLEIDYLNERYPELHLPKDEHHTLSGFLVMTQEEIPEENDKIYYKNLEFTIRKASERKIEEVEVRILNKGKTEQKQNSKDESKIQQDEYEGDETT